MSKVISKKDNYLQNAMEATSDNIAKSSAAITPQMDSTEDFSLKGNPKVLEAVENVDEAKSLDVRDSSNNATVKAAEDNVQTAVKEAQDEKYKFDSNEELNDTDEESALAKGDIEEAVVAAAKAELAAYKTEADYSATGWAAIQAIITEANADLDEAIGNEEEINAIVTDYINGKLSYLPTIPRELVLFITPFFLC